MRRPSSRLYRIKWWVVSDLDCSAGFYANRTHIISDTCTLSAGACTGMTPPRFTLFEALTLRASAAERSCRARRGARCRTRAGIKIMALPASQSHFSIAAIGNLYVAPSRFHRPSSLSPEWSSGRRPSGQRNLRSCSAMGRSLMLAKRLCIRPSALNSQFSLP